MSPSSRSWPLKSNRDTGQNTGRGFTVVVVRLVMARATCHCRLRENIWQFTFKTKILTDQKMSTPPLTGPWNA
jgi:hypothetical protein